MRPVFTRLNSDWNAEPNAPSPMVRRSGENLILRFYMNCFQFPQFEEEDLGEITFLHCARYRMGTVNDEGWYRGQCRFSRFAPEWGEFYEVTGNLLLEKVPDDWITHKTDHSDLRHFLFYFRDQEFECDAKSWDLRILKPGDLE